MNKENRLILTGGILVIIITVLAYVFAYFMKQQLPNYFIAVPAFFILMLIALSLLVKKYNKKETAIDVAGILSVRMIIFFVCFAAFGAGVLLNRLNLITFTVLFALYYIVFSIIETKTLLKLTKKG